MSPHLRPPFRQERGGGEGGVVISQTCPPSSISVRAPGKRPGGKELQSVRVSTQMSTCEHSLCHHLGAFCGHQFFFNFFFLIVCFTSYFVFSIAVLPHHPGVVYYHLLLPPSLFE